jgi:hypothetical protein
MPKLSKGGPFRHGDTSYVVEQVARVFPLPDGWTWTCETGDYGWLLTLTLTVVRKSDDFMLRIPGCAAVGDNPMMKFLYESYSDHASFLREFARWRGYVLLVQARNLYHESTDEGAGNASPET